MIQGTKRFRRAAVAALAAATGLAGLTIAPAGAINPPASVVDVASGFIQGTIPSNGVGLTNQTGSNIILEPQTPNPANPPQWNVGDAFVLQVSDADGHSTTAGSCAAVPADTQQWAATPTAAFNPPSGFTAPTVSFTLQTAPDGCPNDQLRVDVTGAGAGPIILTGIKFNYGPGSAPGDYNRIQVYGAQNNPAPPPSTIPIALNVPGGSAGFQNAGCGAGVVAGGPAAPPAGFTAGNCVTISNAFVTDVLVAGNEPPTALIPVGSQAISNITLTETVPTGFHNAAGANSICLQIVGPTFGPNVPTFDPASPPAVASTSSGGGTEPVSSPATIAPAGGGNNPSQLQIEFTSNAAVQSTITVSNLKVNPNGTSGPIRLVANFGPCVVGGPPAPAVNGPLYTPPTGVIVGAIIVPRRLGGADRISTARIIAELGPAVPNTGGFAGAPTNIEGGLIGPTGGGGAGAGAGGGPGTANPFGDCDVIIARSDLFPDALAASYLAGSPIVFGYAPILLTAPDTLSQEAQDAIRNLGVKQAFIVGGTAAVSTNVENQLRAMVSTANAGTCGVPGSPGATNAGPLQVERIGGSDRFETARRIAERPGTGNVGTVNLGSAPRKTAILATGRNFPDALAAGPMGFQGTAIGGTGSNGFPILLTETGGSLPAGPALTAIQNLGIGQLIIVGGEAAVAGSQLTQICGPAALKCVRLAGPDRQGTAVAIANFELSGTATPTAGGSGNTTNGPVFGQAGLGGGCGNNPQLATSTTTATDASYNTGVGVVGLGWCISHINLARGDNFPDSLAMGPHAGFEVAPLVLTAAPDRLGDTTARFLNTLAGVVTGGFFVVGPPAPNSIQSYPAIDVAGGIAAVAGATVTCASQNLGGFRSC